MESKEKILFGITPNNVWDNVDENLCNCPPRYIYQVMDEYAKQMACEFAEWMDLKHLGTAEIGVYSYNSKYYKIPELYQIFLNEKSK